MLKELKLKDYQEYVKASADLTENEIGKAIYDMINDTNIDNPKQKDINKAIIDFDLFIKESKSELNSIVKINDAELGFIPDLENMTFGEVVDLDAYIGNIDDHHKLMAILYRPILDRKGNKYRILDYNGTNNTSEKMRNLPLKYYFSALGFFDRLGKDLQIAFPSYLPQQEIATI